MQTHSAGGQCERAQGAWKEKNWCRTAVNDRPDAKAELLLYKEQRFILEEQYHGDFAAYF